MRGRQTGGLIQLGVCVSESDASFSMWDLVVQLDKVEGKVDNYYLFV